MKKLVLFLLIVVLGGLLGYVYRYDIFMRIMSIKARKELTGVIKRDLVYKTIDGKDIKLDLYLPLKIGEKKAPLIIYVHGGYWSGGDKEQELSLLYNGIQRIREMGYAVASVNYRLTDKHTTFPAHIEDVRWLRSKSDEYFIESNDIGIMGASAGGHLALLAGLSNNKEFLGTPELIKYPSEVKYIISWFGPTDLRGLKGKVIEEFLGAAEDKKPEIYKRASPLTYINKDSPPILLIHGDKDEVVALEQSEKLYEAGKRLGNDINLVVVKNAKHGFIKYGNQKIDPDINEIADITWKFVTEKSKILK